MKVIVMGAGVVGITTAWYLNKLGHEVTVVDRQAAAANETSYANGGQISVSHAEPWANPSAPAKVIKWLMREDAPLLFRFRADLRQWRWGFEFLKQCSAKNTRHNIVQLLNLGSYSRKSLQELRAEAGIEYNQLTKGILHFYTSQEEFDGAKGPTELMREMGCDRRLITTQEAIQIEPSLKNAEKQIVGATYTDADESGDARLFTQNLAKLCQDKGVTFLYGTQILGINAEGGRVSGIRAIVDGGHKNLVADAYVLSMGSFSPQIAQEVGVSLNIYPAKGYSATVQVKRAEEIPYVSLTDDEYKLVYSRLGDKLRIAGTAELNGYSRELNAIRCQALTRRGKELFGDAGDWDNATFWTGLRPSTPSNVPYIGSTKLAGLFLNTGHGTLGWTHACGSGRALADLISGKKPDVDFAFCRP
jgi:D-amino-acid dehydrogenase